MSSLPAPGPSHRTDPRGSDAHPTADREEVASLLAAMASGDEAATFTLAARHGHRIAGVVRRHLRRCGVDRIAPEDLDGLVLDACLALRDVAGSWRADGALPWWWAQGRIGEVVQAWVGVHADSLDVDGHRRDVVDDAPPAPVDEESVAETFARLVAEVPVVGLVEEARAAARLEHESLLCILEYRMQQALGDPSPAATLAPRYGVTPEALRQRVSRGRRRLRAAVAADPRLAPLAGLALVA